MLRKIKYLLVECMLAVFIFSYVGITLLFDKTIKLLRNMLKNLQKNLKLRLTIKKIIFILPLSKMRLYYGK